MTTIDYTNAKLIEMFDGCDDTALCWVDRENGAVLREFEAIDLADDDDELAINTEYVQFWDVGRETTVGAWVNEDGAILEICDETTRAAMAELDADLVPDGFWFGF